jgi:hypothetical protein
LPPDPSSLNAAISALYEAISFEEGERPDLARFCSLFEKGARLVHAQVGDVERLSLEEFVDRLDERAGASMAWLREREIARRQQRFGCIAQVFSTFEAELRMFGDAAPRSFRGINAIQLRHAADRWLITALLWTDESPDQAIPATFLP